MNDALATVDRTATVMDSWTVMREKANVLVKSGFLPKAINTPEKAITIMQTGQELGLGVMQSLRGIHVVDMRPTLSAELMAALVYQRIPGATLRVVETTDVKCVMDAGRPGQQPTRFTWTMADAKAAGLTGKQNWRTYPRAMLRSRVTSEACRAVFPDAIMGMYTPEELEPVQAAVSEVASLPPRAVPAQFIDAEHEPPRQELPAPAEPYRFKGGECPGMLITEVPTNYLQRLGKHGLKADMRKVVDAELARRNTSEYIASKLSESVRQHDDSEGRELENVDPDTGEVKRTDPWGLDGDATMPEPGAGDAP